MVTRNIVEIELNEAEIKDAIKKYIESNKSEISVKKVEMVYDTEMKISGTGLVNVRKMVGCKAICTEGD